MDLDAVALRSFDDLLKPSYTAVFGRSLSECWADFDSTFWNYMGFCAEYIGIGLIIAERRSPLIG